MGLFDNLNNNRKWTKDTTGFEYIKLREYLDTNGWEIEIPVFGYYINKLELGEACTVITSDCYINLPSHAVAAFKKLSIEQIDAIDSGKMVLRNFKEITTKKFKNKTIVFDYADI